MFSSIILKINSIMRKKIFIKGLCSIGILLSCYGLHKSYLLYLKSEHDKKTIQSVFVYGFFIGISYMCDIILISTILDNMELNNNEKQYIKTCRERPDQPAILFIIV